MGINHSVLLIFAPLLVLVGILGFVVPERKSLTSGAPAYNLFHIVFGCLGIIVLFSGESRLIRGSNIVFGMIDLYQALASRLEWFPRELFRWKKADDVLHVVIGPGPVAIGSLAGYGFLYSGIFDRSCAPGSARSFRTSSIRSTPGLSG